MQKRAKVSLIFFFNIFNAIIHFRNTVDSNKAPSLAKCLSLPLALIPVSASSRILGARALNNIQITRQYASDIFPAKP